MAEGFTHSRDFGRPHFQHTGFTFQSHVADVLPQRNERTAAFLDKGSVCRSPAQGFETQCAGTGKQVSDPPTGKRRIAAMLQDGKDPFAHATSRRTCSEPLWRSELLAAVFPGDNMQGLALFLFGRIVTHAARDASTRRAPGRIRLAGLARVLFALFRHQLVAALFGAELAAALVARLAGLWPGLRPFGRVSNLLLSALRRCLPGFP